MTNHDQLFKQLLSTFFVEFVELFCQDLADYLDASSLQFLDKELFSDVLAGEEYEADLVARVRVRGQQSFFLVHIEAQSQAQTGFGLRMFRYFAYLYGKYGLPVYPIAVLSFEQPLGSQLDTYRVAFPDLEVLQFRYRVVQLNRLDWRTYADLANPVASALMARMRIPREERVQVKLACLQMLASLGLDLARSRLVSGFIDAYLNLSEEEEQMFEQELASIEPREREGVMEIVTSWMRRGLEEGRQEGRQEGKQEGKQEGRQQGKQELLLRLLSGRFGPLGESVTGQILLLSVAQLDELGDASLGFAQLEDLSVWLQSLPRSSQER